MAHRVLIVFGTRPEAIKIAPVVRALHASADFEPVVAVTAQHREMLDQVLEAFDIRPAFDLGIMQHGQALDSVTARALTGLGDVISEVGPDCLMVQGDTTTTFAGALSGFYHRVPVAHVEAGYRTSDPYEPFPEEMNRRLVSELASWHFAANESCRAHLLAEGHPAERIRVVGNTGIDALKLASSFSADKADPGVQELIATTERVVLMTMHRRENWGGPIEQACLAARDIIEARPDVRVLFATHLNPIVREAAQRVLAGVDRVHLLPALDYLTFVQVLARADLVMSDSGGIHEESLALGKPLLLLRNVTEWPEAVERGAVRLAGTDRAGIVKAAGDILDALDAGVPLPLFENPLADGRASERVVSGLLEFLGGADEP